MQRPYIPTQKISSRDIMKHITQEPIDIRQAIEVCRDPSAGAVVVFSGEVRNMNAGKEVSALEYEAYDVLANNLIGEVLAAAHAKWELTGANCVHRTGKLAIGDPAVVVVTASPHRKEAYAANQYIIDRVKHEAPIWKKEYYTDGASEWGSNCNCHLPHESHFPLEGLGHGH